MKAQATLKALEDQENEVDRLYIIEKGITNPDGTVPPLTFMIEDDATAENAFDEINVVARGAACAVIAFGRLNGDGQRRTDRFTQFAGNAALFPVGVTAQRMQTAEPG